MPDHKTESAVVKCCSQCSEPFEDSGDRAPSREEPTYCNECLDESFAAGGHYSERMIERAIDAADRMRDE